MNSRISFTSYIVEIIKNTAINYKKKRSYILNKEIQSSEKNEIEEIICIENEIKDEEVERINYQELEKIFTKKEYYNAMKWLRDREKLVLYLNVIKQLSLETIAILLNTNVNNISKIKYRAKNKFYCPFCRRNCGGEGNSRSVPISVSKLRKEDSSLFYLAHSLL